MTTIPEHEPQYLTSGLTWQWRKSLTEYPASAGWTVSYLFSGPAGGFEVVAVADGDGHAVNESAAATATRPAGEYRVAGVARKGDDAFGFFTGAITVAALPNASGATQTSDERILAAVTASLEGRLTGSGYEEVTVDGTHVKHIPVAELEKIRSRYQMRCAAARARAAGAGNPFGVQIQTVFRG